MRGLNQSRISVKKDALSVTGSSLVDGEVISLFRRARFPDLRQVHSAS